MKWPFLSKLMVFGGVFTAVLFMLPNNAVAGRQAVAFLGCSAPQGDAKLIGIKSLNQNILRQLAKDANHYQIVQIKPKLMRKIRRKARRACRKIRSAECMESIRNEVGATHILNCSLRPINQKNAAITLTLWPSGRAFKERVSLRWKMERESYEVVRTHKMVANLSRHIAAAIKPPPPRITQPKPRPRPRPQYRPPPQVVYKPPPPRRPRNRMEVELAHIWGVFNFGDFGDMGGILGLGLGMRVTGIDTGITMTASGYGTFIPGGLWTDVSLGHAWGSPEQTDLATEFAAYFGYLGGKKQYGGAFRVWFRMGKTVPMAQRISLGYDNFGVSLLHNYVITF